MNLNSGRNKRRQMAEINVVPYIDVMLVLLVIFMITAPLLNQGVKVDLPKTKAQAIKQKDKEPIIVSLNAQGEYFLNINAKPTQVISAGALTAQVQQALVGNDPANPRQVLVKADENINYGMVVKLMALLQHAGAPSVGLVTDLPGAEDKTDKHLSNGNAWKAG